MKLRTEQRMAKLACSIQLSDKGAISAPGAVIALDAVIAPDGVSAPVAVSQLKLNSNE